MRICLPFWDPKHTYIRPFKRCITEVADQTGLTERDVYVVLSIFFAALSRRVAEGCFVLIPGFGAFCQLYHRFTPRWDKEPTKRRRFVGFWAEATVGAEAQFGTPPEPEAGTQFSRYRAKCQSALHRRTQARCWKYMARARAAVNRQVGRWDDRIDKSIA